jgi:hypothetical protein
MPNLAPVMQPKKFLRNEWFRVVPNPVDETDDGFCIQVLQGPFSHTIYKYVDFKIIDDPETADVESVKCSYSYDIVMSPSDIGERDITQEEGEIFERIIGEVLLELIWEASQNEN